MENKLKTSFSLQIIIFDEVRYVLQDDTELALEGRITETNSEESYQPKFTPYPAH